MKRRRASRRGGTVYTKATTSPTDGTYTYSSGGKRRRKTDWAGIGPGDAFKASLDYQLKLAAQSRFYSLVRKVQLAAARVAGYGRKTFEARAKPQLAPCYTSYPAAISAYAAAGLSGYLEFTARASPQILRMHMEDYLDDPARHHRANVDPQVLKRLAKIVAELVETRMLLEDLSHEPSMASVDVYRLFSASQQDASFPSIPSILSTVILYGDVMAGVDESGLHHTARALHEDISRASEPFAARLTKARAAGSALQLGDRWVLAICRSLLPYLPPPQPDTDDERPSGRRQRDRLRQQLRRHELAILASGDDDEAVDLDQPIPPLNDPSPPALFDPPSAPQRLAQALGEALREFASDSPGAVPQEADDQQVRELLGDFAHAIQHAAGQHSNYEDMRLDLLEQALQGAGFKASPIEGTPVDGNEVSVALGNQEALGEIFDRPVDLSHDDAAHDRLLSEAGPITDALRRTLYPNVRELPRTVRLCTGGSLDPARLALAQVSDVVYQRYLMEEQPDRRGKPVLLIACDGSGSLNPQQMRMTKVLAAGWLRSTARSGVVVVAGLYHSGIVRGGVAGPLVQWMYHPRKTASVSPRDATRALVTLPDDGTGVQSDALSLSFMLDEAKRLSRGRMVYMIMISDCEWNRSLRSGMSGEDEVRTFLETTYDHSGDTLHTTLVALGVNGETGFENVVDRVITVSDDSLTDYAAVAEQIGVYVASCMRERRALVSRR